MNQKIRRLLSACCSFAFSLAFTLALIRAALWLIEYSGVERHYHAIVILALACLVVRSKKQELDGETGSLSR